VHRVVIDVAVRRRRERLGVRGRGGGRPHFRGRPTRLHVRRRRRRNRIARWNGSAWQPLGSGLNGDALTAVRMPNGDLVVGGSFTQAGGLTANGVRAERHDVVAARQWHRPAAAVRRQRAGARRDAER
jgi:hypothetical protein